MAAANLDACVQAGSRPTEVGSQRMNWHRINRLGLVVAIAALVAAACGGTTPTTSTNWKTAASLDSGGGMDALVAAAKAEGQLNIIATPPDWANYGANIEAFKVKYGIKVN